VKLQIGMLRVPQIRPSMLLALSIAGFALVFASSLASNIEWIPVQNQLGLLQMLPLGFWAGVSIIAASIGLGWRNDNEVVFFSQVALLYISVWGAPALFELNPSAWDPYMHYGSVTGIINAGRLSNEFSYAYQNNFPGFFMVIVSYILVGDPSPLSLLRWYPIFASVLTLLALCLFVRTYLPRATFRTAFVIAMMADVWVQITFSPQSLGLAVGLLIFVFMEKQGSQWHFLAGAAFIFLVISHPTTTIFVAGGMMIREIIVRWRRFALRASDKPMENPWPVLAFILIWLGWLLTAARLYFSQFVDQVIGRLSFLVQASEVVQGTVSMRTGGNLWPYPPFVRLGTVGLLVLLALIALSIHLYLRRRTGIRFSAVPLALFLVPAVFVPMDILLLNSQLYDRGILFIVISSTILVSLGFFFIRRMPKVRTILICVIILAAAACWSTVYYQESLYVVSNQSLDASQFLQEHLQPGALVLGGRIPFPSWFGSGDRVFTPAPDWAFYNITLGTLAGEGIVTTAIFDRSADLWMTQYGSVEYDFYRAQAGANDMIFDSGDYHVVFGWVGAP